MNSGQGIGSTHGIVSIIDDNTNSIIGNTLVGIAPQDAAVNPGSGRVYITNLLSNTVSVISSSSIISPVQGIQDLIQSIQTMNTIDPAVKTSLISTLNTALYFLTTTNPGNYIAACNQLNAFNNQVYAGVQYEYIDQLSGTQLVQSSQAIQQLIGC
jgi:DNA-binding beta-propeller fold protein YncE